MPLCTFPQDLLQPFLEYYFKQKHQGVDTVKFRCDRDALSEALQTVQRGVSSRPGIPALTGVLIESTDDGLSGEEGTFTICSFWLVSALA